jgi:hypothetical protein
VRLAARGRQSDHAPSGVQITRFGTTSGSHLGDQFANHIGSARVLPRPSMTQRYEMDDRLADRAPKQRTVDTVFGYSNISEGN